MLRILLFLALAVLSSFSVAQPTGSIQSISPITRDNGAIRTLSATGASTVNSADQDGYNVSRVVCVFSQSTYTGSPSTTFSIQNKDRASGLYYSLVTNSAVTTTLLGTSVLSAGAGVATVANAGAGIPIAKTWRVSATVAGSSTPTVTGTIGCSVQ